MAEIVGLVASIAAIIQITGQITVFGFQYFESVKSVPKDLENLVAQLSSFNKVLISLRTCCEDNKLPPQTLRKLNQQINECVKDLDNELKKILSILAELRNSRLGGRREKFGALLKRLKWPMNASQTNTIIAKIECHKSNFTLALNVDQMSMLGKIDAKIESLRADATAKDVTKKRKDVLEWLFEGKFDTRHHQISRERQENTGGWLLNTPEFKRFTTKQNDPKKRMLWGYGIPGAGKTFLSSLVVDDLNTKASAAKYGVAHIYFNFKEQDQQKPIHILGSLTKQLAGRIQTLPKTIDELYNKLTQQMCDPNQKELYSAFLSTFSSFDQIFLVFDALDECDPREQLEKFLPLFHRMAEDGANIFLTSRPGQDDISDSFRDIPTIELTAKVDDITTYIEARIIAKKRVERLIQKSKCEDRIIPELVACANGMFLLVHFHVEYLCQQTTAKQFLHALNSLRDYDTAGGIDPTYDRAILSLQKQGKVRTRLGLKILLWLVTARRPLTVDELQVAVSVERDRYELDDMDLPDVETLLDVCASLVMVDEDSQIIRLVHFTAQEYLVRKGLIPDDAEIEVAITCITFVSFDIFSQGACASFGAFKNRIKSNPFLDYAARHLSIHVINCGSLLPPDSILKFLERSGNADSYLQVFYAAGNPQRLTLYPKQCLPLHVASIIGHYATVEHLVAKKANVLARNKFKDTALHLAAYAGHTAIVRLLLASGADPSIKGKSGHSPLNSAAIRGHEEIFRILLDSNANISGKSYDGGTILHTATRHQKISIIKLLFEMGAADPSAPNNVGYTPLHEAVLSCRGELSVVQFLLSKGADLSATAKDGSTVLHLAAKEGYESTVRLLLDKGADITASDKIGGTALHWAAAIQGDPIPIFRLLLDKGADFSVSGEGATALELAQREWQEPIVQLLLERDADLVSVYNKHGGTTLHFAARHGYDSIVKLLLDQGAEISARDENGETPLHFAACYYKSTVQLLLDNGADISAQDNHGWTPLHSAACIGEETIVQLLLDRGADLSVRNKQGRTALGTAVDNGAEQLVLVLRERYPDADEGIELSSDEEDEEGLGQD